MIFFSVLNRGANKRWQTIGLSWLNISFYIFFLLVCARARVCVLHTKVKIYSELLMVSIQYDIEK